MIIFSFVVISFGFLCYLDIKTYGKFNQYGGKKAIVSNRGVPPFGLALDFIGISPVGE